MQEHMYICLTEWSFCESWYQTFFVYYRIASPTQNLSTAFPPPPRIQQLYSCWHMQVNSWLQAYRNPSALSYTHQLFVTTLDVHQS